MRQELRSVDGDGFKRRLGRRSVQAVGVHVIGVGVAFLSQLALTRVLGIEGYGIYAFVFACITVLTRFATLGFGTSILRFVSVYRAEERWGLAQSVIRYAERRVVLGSIGVALIGVAAVVLGRGRLSEPLFQTFLVGFAVIPIWALLRVRSSVVRALGGLVSAIAPDRAIREGVLVTLVGVAGFGLSWTVNAPMAMAATLLGAAVGLVVVTLSASRRRARELGGHLPSTIDPAWRRAAMPLLIVAGAQLLMNRTAVIMSGLLLDTASAGLIALAANISVLVNFPQVAINTVFTPAIAALHARGNHRDLQSIVSTAAWWITLAALVSCLPLFIFAESVLALFGPDFSAATNVFRILLVGQFINAAAGPVLQIMHMTGKEYSAAVILVSSTCIGVALNALLIVSFGLNGAAIAAALTLVTWNGAMVWFLWRHLALRPGVFGAFHWLTGARLSNP